MSTKKNILLLGGHMSISGGFHQAVERGESINCTAIQIFTRSNRQWQAKKLTQESADLFRQARKGSCIRSVVSHLPYLVNIGSPNEDTYKKSVSLLKEELKRCDTLGIKYMILHPGSHLKDGEQTCLDRIVRGLNAVFANDTGQTMILLENMAGQGTNVGYQFEHLGYIIKKVNNKNRVGVCFDTCHAFAAGYDFRKQDGYDDMWRKFDKHVGLQKLKAFHINDSKKELGSRVDRHENIGQGKIGLGAFRLLFNDERFFKVPKVLETPKPTPELYVKNMKVIKRLLSPKTKKLLDVE